MFNINACIYVCTSLPPPTKNNTMECKFKFSNKRNEDGGVIKLDGQEIPKNKCVRYLGSIIHKDGEIKEGVNHRICG